MWPSPLRQQNCLTAVTAKQLVKAFTNHSFGVQTGARFSLQNKVWSGMSPAVYIPKASKCCCTLKCLRVHALSEDKDKKKVCSSNLNLFHKSVRSNKAKVDEEVDWSQRHGWTYFPLLWQKRSDKAGHKEDIFLNSKKKE